MTYEIRELGPVRLELSSMLKSQISFSDFCQPAGTIDFKAHNGFLKSNLKLFSFTYHKFVFEAKIRDGMIFIMRNGHYQHSEEYLGDGSCQVALQWDIDSIGCGIVSPDALNNMNTHMRAVRTPITILPSEIVNILRTENLLNNSRYENMDIFFGTVIDSIHCCNLDIRRHGTERLLWKKSSSNQVKPVDEPDISRFVASFLSVYGVMKNFDVTCESIAGLGSMDFYIVAPVGDKIGRIAIEAKKAESDDLINGFTKQLPNYMQRIGTSYGIYLIYWLKSPDYPYPKKYNKYVYLEIEELHPISRPETIRTLGLDLSKEANPSS
ncbi:MAG: hypothetical protein KKG99_05560 [Bacteroidetes bacterium]|nr:hypothetical protein [Bacteroidota bacterium]